MRAIFISLTTCYAALICGATQRTEQLAENLAALQRNPHDVRLTKETGYLYLNLNEYDKALAFGKRLLAESKRKDSGDFARMHGHIILGQAYTHISDQSGAFDNLEKARVIAERNHDHDALFSVYNGLGIYYDQMRANRYSALAAFTRALAEADSVGNTRNQAIVLYNLAGMWLHGQETSEVRYAERAYELARELADTELEYYCCILLSGFGITEEKPEEARRWLNRARSIMADKHLDSTRFYLATAEANYYVLTGDNEKAEKTYRLTLDNIGSLDPAMRTNMCYRYGNFLIMTGKTNQGISILEEGLKHAVNTGMAVDSCGLLLAMAHGYNSLGNPSKAYELLEQRRQITERRQKQADQESYVENRIKNDIRLNELQIQQQKAQLLRRERNLTIVISIALVLGVALVLVLFFYRRKNKLYSSIVKQNRQTMERERVLMESLEAERTRNAVAPSLPQTARSGSEEKIADLADRFTLMMIRDHLYTDPNISIASAAEALGTNRTYLSRAINNSTGHTFSEVINQYRIRRAIELISDTSVNLQLKNVATEVGFNSRSAFYTAFRNITGMTPTQYREKVSETTK